MNHVVMFSGGVGSWAAAKRVAEQHGTEHLTLLFTDTKMEDEDLYRFLEEGARNVFNGADPRLVIIADGRTPWEVFHDVKFLGNSLYDPCSRALKRNLADKWLTEHFNPADTIIYVGIDYTEEHRYTRLAKRKLEKGGWVYRAPLCEPPELGKPAVFDWLKREGIEAPRLYALGFSHNNCGGFCIKAGQGHFANLLEKLPERYAEHEAQEERFQKTFNFEATVLRETIEGDQYRLSLRELRERIQAGKKIDRQEIGGCGCAVDDNE